MKNDILKYIIYWIASIVFFVLLAFGYLFLGNSTYRSDRFFILFRDDSGKDNVLMVQLIKYNTFPHFYHYKYTANLTKENSKVISKKFEYNSFNDNFKAKDFIKEIANKNNENTLREDYFLKMEISNKEFLIDLKDLNGDFLINNSLERLTYINMGDSIIVIDGKKYPADFALNKTTSMQYTRAILEQMTKSKGDVFFLSDNQGGLYYADITNVYEKKSDYISHKWALYKKGSILKKDVNEKISLTNNSEKQAISLPLFDNAQISLIKLSEFKLEKNSYTLFKGELIDDLGEKTIIGFGLNYDNK